MELGFVGACEVVGGEEFVGGAGAMGIEGGVEVVFFEGVEVAAEAEGFVPGVEAGAELVGGFEGITEAAVGAGEECFEERAL